MPLIDQCIKSRKYLLMRQVELQSTNQYQHYKSSK